MNKIKCYKNKQWLDVDPLINWDLPEFKNKDFQEVLGVIGFSPNSFLRLGGFEFPDFEVFDWNFRREKASPYLFYAALSLSASDRYEDIVFESQIDLLDFLREYAPAFQLVRQNILDQRDWDTT